MKIGAYELANRLVLAPMAGVTDRPFRELCKRHGAGMAVSEMVTSDTRLWSSRKSSTRMDHSGELEPRIVQIAGADPEVMAEAAAGNVALGAQVIDINMGCERHRVAVLVRYVRAGWRRPRRRRRVRQAAGIKLHLRHDVRRCRAGTRGRRQRRPAQGQRAFDRVHQGHVGQGHVAPLAVHCG